MVEIPPVQPVDLVLEEVELVVQLVGLLLREVGIPHLLHDLVVSVNQVLDGGHRLLKVPAHGLLGVQTGLLGHQQHPHALGDGRRPHDFSVLPRHDAKQGRLAGAIVADNPNLGTKVEG